MGRELNRLSALAVKAATPGKHPDGGGLWLHRRGDGGAQWFLRVTVGGRRREMGLGALADVSLRDARTAAAKWRVVAAAGLDPIKERDRERRAAAAQRPTVDTVARECFEARKAQLKGDGKAGRWWSPLELHVLPKLGKVPVEDIDQNDVKNALSPIWHEKGETAKKALTRLRVVLKHAVAMGLNVDMQACDKARVLLGKSRQKAEHIPALPWQDVPDFYATLAEQSPCHLALRLLILTAARSAEVRFARFEEIDGDVWTIPPARTKTGREHRIPLCGEALAVVEAAKPLARDGFLFHSVRKGVISDATMARMMQRRGMAERPHGFRASFRTWCAEATDTPREVAEAALGHTDGTAVERAYRRTDHLERRRVLMQRWASYATGGGAAVVQHGPGRGNAGRIATHVSDRPWTSPCAARGSPAGG
jgi:integrase